MSVREDQAFLDESQITIEEFEMAMQGVSENVTEFCGTIDRDFFADTISTTSNFICAVIGLTLKLRDALACRTLMPLYYNTCEYFADERIELFGKFTN